MKMTVAILFSLHTSLSLAASSFGGVQFHSQLPVHQVELLKLDLRYLFSAPTTTTSPELGRNLQLPIVDGPHLHNALVNRIRWLIPADFSLDIPNLIHRRSSKFADTPVPDEAKTEDLLPSEITVSNVGGTLYLSGKVSKVTLGLNLDGTAVYATSPRVGIAQVGDALFAPASLVKSNPKAPANSIARLGIFFHGARHSDGSGKSTGFKHTTCPTGHDYAGKAACDLSSNGPYTISAQVERHLMLNCTSCSETDKTKLAANVADSLSRVLKNSDGQVITQLRTLISTYEETREMYQQMLEVANAPQASDIRREITKLDTKIKDLKVRLADQLAQANMQAPVLWESKPEGQFTNISLQTSTKAMQQSLGSRP